MTGPSGLRWDGGYSKMPHGFWSSAPVLAAGERAAALLLRMSDFASSHELDGYLTPQQLRTLGVPRQRLTPDLSRLLQVGLIEGSDADGWRIVGWLDGHRSSAEIAEIREKRRSAGRKGGKAKAENASKVLAPDEANCQPTGKQVARGLLYPDTDTDTDTDTQRTTSSAGPRVSAPQPADEAEALSVELLSLAGMAEGTRPTKGEVATVTKLLRKGYTREHLEYRAARASQADVNPRALLLKLLSDDLNQEPDLAPTGSSGPVSAALGIPIPMLGQRAPERDDDWGTQWNYLTGGGGRSHMANETAKQAWHEIRMIRKYQKAEDAKWAFRDAYKAISTGVPA